MTRIYLFVLLSFIFSRTGSAQNYSDTLNVKLAKFYSQNALPGFTVAIVNMDGVLYQNSYGYADIKSKSPYTLRTIQSIASVSKTTIAFAIMKLYEEGKLQLESPINNFLPYQVFNPHFPDSIIRIKHLVTHTSGIVDTDNNYDLRGQYFIKKTDLKKSDLEQEDLDWFRGMKKNKKLSLKKYCKNVFSKRGRWNNWSTFLKHSPGSHYQYTNLGAVLMAHIVERVSGKCYKDYINKELFKPLNMKESTFDESKVPSNLLATSYVTHKLLATPILGNNTYPDGGLHTNNIELSKYLIEMIKGYNGKSTLLSKKSFHKMMSPLLSQEVASTSKEGKNFSNIGVFWHVAVNRHIYHNGGNPLGGTVYMWFDPSTNIGTILMTNCDGSASRETVVEFISIWRTLGKYAVHLAAN